MKVKCMSCGKKFHKQGINAHVRKHERENQKHPLLAIEAGQLDHPTNPVDRKEELSYREREVQISLAHAFAQLATTFSTIFGEWRR